MESYLEKALKEGHLRIDASGKFEKIVYAAAGKSEPGLIRKRRLVPNSMQN